MLKTAIEKRLWIAPVLMAAAVLTVTVLHTAPASAGDSNRDLIIAAFNNDLQGVKASMSKGASVDTHDRYGKTTLMWAVVNENMEMVKYLVSKGADVNARDVEGTTPLMWAVVTGNAAIVKFLLSRGADLNARDIYGKTALMCARERGHKRIAAMLSRPVSRH